MLFRSTATVPVSVSAVFDQLGAAMQARGGGGSPADSPGMHNVHADLSNDGRFVTFTADWSVLSGGSQSYRQDIVLYDRDVDGNGVFDEPGSTNLALVSASSADVRGNANSYYPVVSDGGRFEINVPLRKPITRVASSSLCECVQRSTHSALVRMAERRRERVGRVRRNRFAHSQDHAHHEIGRAHV